MKDLEFFRKRLLYNSQHRGMRELDLLLGHFAQKSIPSMNQEELEQFDLLLSYPDQDLYGWFFENVQIPEDAPHSLIGVIFHLHEFKI